MKRNHKKSINENWTESETQTYLHNRDKKRTEKLKDSRKGKRFEMVKVCDMPLTYKEIEVKPET